MGNKFRYNPEGYATKWTPTGLDPAKDVLQNYKGAPGQRLTDWEAIKRGLEAGEIQTDAGRLIESWRSMGDGKVSARQGPADYEQATLGQWLGADWRTGNLSLERFSNPEYSNLPDNRLDYLAKYIGAANTRLNTRDSEMETAHLEEEIEALNINRRRKADYDSGLKRSSGVRYKRAIMGSLRTNNMVPGLYRSRGFAVTEGGDIIGFPAEDPPTYP